MAPPWQARRRSLPALILSPYDSARSVADVPKPFAGSGDNTTRVCRGSSPSLIENSTLPQRLGYEVPGRVFPGGGFLLAVDHDVLGYREMGEGTPQQGRLA